MHRNNVPSASSSSPKRGPLLPVVFLACLAPSAAAAQSEASAPELTPALDEPTTTPPVETSPGAQPAAAAAGPGDAGQVQYGAVDDSTVRVFAVGSVGVDSFEFDGAKIHFAITNAGHGTGFAVGSGRLVATARHVVEDAIHVVVRRPGDAGFGAARVVYKSNESDIAILSIEDTLAPLRLAPDNATLRVRSTVFAVGYPLDATRKFAQSARGIIAGSLDDGTLQIDMDINPGNSGGPLLDTNDQVVGMVVARARMGAGAQGIGYAVPLAELADAVARAEATLASGAFAGPSEAQRKSAVVVDELVQTGALRSLQDASDLKDGLRGDNLRRSLDRISAGVEDPGLLAFIAGNLWNASLFLRYGDVEQIGENRLSARESLELAGRMEREAIRLSKIAYRRDPAIVQQSSFVDFARRRSSARPRQVDDREEFDDAPEPVTNPRSSQPVRIWGGYNVRMNPDTGSTGGGGFFGAAVELSRERDFQPGKFVPILGASLGIASITSEMDADLSFRHMYGSAEIGGFIRVSENFDLGATWAPGIYLSTVDDDGTSESALILAHARAWASFTVGNLTLSTGFRTLSGPTFWFEPIAIGLRF